MCCCQLNFAQYRTIAGMNFPAALPTPGSLNVFWVAGFGVVFGVGVINPKHRMRM